MKLAVHCANLSWAGGPEKLGSTLADVARTADDGGLSTLTMMDHWFQMEMLGGPPEPMLEGYTSLGFLAGQTSRIELGLLVTGVTYRHPGLLAKTVTTLDVVSHGRAVLGIGAGWFEREHHDYGFEFGTFGQRFERLEEALNIIAPMLKGEPATLDGKWYTARGAMNNPRLRPNIPIMLGGSGEQKTFRLAARFADHMNIICMGGRTVGVEAAWDLVQAYLAAEYSQAERHLRRLGKVASLEARALGTRKA